MRFSTYAGDAIGTEPVHGQDRLDICKPKDLTIRIAVREWSFTGRAK